MRRAAAGRALMVGFEGRQVNDQVREQLKFGVGGFILFRRNLESAEQTAELIAEIRALAPGRRLLLAVDEEGGRVSRLRSFGTMWPSMREGGRLDPETLERFGAALGTELAVLGFDLDFAPVADVDTRADNPVIGDRSFGGDAWHVAACAAAVVRGLQGAGVMACAKHFPGHGDTEVDSHHELPFVAHSRRRFDEVEFVPFHAVIEAGVAAVMTAHLVAADLDAKRAATMSSKVLGILRNEMGFGGVVFSDDLEMGAIADHYPTGEAAVLAAAAGCDMLLVCLEIAQQEAAFRALFDGAVPDQRLREMNRRLDALAARFPEPQRGDLSRVGCDEHRVLAARLRSGLTPRYRGV